LEILGWWTGTRTELLEAPNQQVGLVNMTTSSVMAQTPTDAILKTSSTLSASGDRTRVASVALSSTSALIPAGGVPWVGTDAWVGTDPWPTG
jgi:hypothetical protein